MRKILQNYHRPTLRGRTITNVRCESRSVVVAFRARQPNTNDVLLYSLGRVPLGRTLYPDFDEWRRTNSRTWMPPVFQNGGDKRNGAAAENARVTAAACQGPLSLPRALPYTRKRSQVSPYSRLRLYLLVPQKDNQRIRPPPAAAVGENRWAAPAATLSQG